MASDDGLRERLGKKLTNRKAESAASPSSTDLPSHFRRMEVGTEDVTRASGQNAGAFMHQSIFSMIPAFAGRGHSNFQSRFDDDPSESEEDRGEVQNRPQSTADGTGDEGGGEKRRKGRILSNMANTMKLKQTMTDEDTTADRMSSSQILPSRPKWHDAQEDFDERKIEDAGPSSQAPVLSRMLTAEAEMEASQATESSRSKKDALEGRSKIKQPVSLAERLKEIFDFDEPEEVITEYPCWFLQTVLLQGYMYITQKHVCFYAYLPKKDTEISKSGYLSKRQHVRPKQIYRRFFFELRGDYLTYFTDSSQKIFPYGHIDLRYAISAAIEPSKDKNDTAMEFKVTTDKRDYHFRAESAESAKSWVRQLQRVIFRSSNEGDSVKISLPIDNVIGIESNQSLDFADTIKLQVIDNNETFAIDDFLFSFFNRGEEAYKVLKIMVDDNNLHSKLSDIAPPSPPVRVSGDSRRSRQPSTERERACPGPSDLSKANVEGNVRATLSLFPLNTPTGRSTPEGTKTSQPTSGRKGRLTGRKQSSEREQSKDSQRSARTTSPVVDMRNAQSPTSSKPHDSSDSVSRSLAQDTESSAAIQSLDDTDVSASKMLERSTLFHTPTVQRFERSASVSSADRNRRGSEDTARSLALSKEARLKQNAGEQPRASDLVPPSTAVTAGEPSMERPSYKKRQSHTNQSYVLRDLVRAGANPLQTATGVAEYLTKRSKDMSSLLATESMGYYEKVSGMWAGKRKHYDASPGLSVGDEVHEEDDEENTAGASQRFRDYFALSEKDQLKAIYFASIQRVLPLYGKIYISNKHFCFRSLLPGTWFKVVLPFEQIENVNKERGYRPGHPGVVIVIRGFEELFFEFSRKDDRDDCVVTLLQSLEQTRYMQEPSGPTLEERPEAETAKLEHQLLQEARQDGSADQEQKLPGHTAVHEVVPEAPPIFFDDPLASILNFKPVEPLRITCLTIGSRGDVQPYIALCKGLVADGHKPCIATHIEFKDWVLSHGIDFAPVEGDPAELMRICVENGMFTVNFLREATSKFRGWLDGLLVSAWQACQGTDLLIESPSAMGGIHIAEALEIPYVRAFSMPWTRTRAYPHAFGVPERRMGGYYNYMTYVMFERVFWKAIAGQINSWRKKELGLGSTNYDMLQSNKVPFLYFYSPSVVPPPADYSEWIRITGYWFLDVGGDFKPPQDIVRFVAQARKDGKKIVYIGFGSIVVEDPAALTQTVVDSVLKADVRCILSKGWSDRLGKKDATSAEIPLPPEILQIKGAPHDWLFKQIDAAVHHGGSGTTGASLRAGIPTIIKPFFGDQYFFGSRVEALGVGICLYKINVKVLAKALWEATHSQRLQVKARVLGEQIRKVSLINLHPMMTFGTEPLMRMQEDGVAAAIQTIYRDLEYARTLSKRRNKQSDGAAEVEEETWAFVGDESEPDLRKAVGDLGIVSKRSFEGMHQRGVTAT